MKEEQKFSSSNFKNKICHIAVDQWLFVFILEFFLNMKIMWIYWGIIIVNNEHKYILKNCFFLHKKVFFFLSRLFNICIMHNIESRKKILIVTEQQKWDEPVGAISEWDSSWLQKSLLSFPISFNMPAYKCVFLCNKFFYDSRTVLEVDAESISYF